MTLSKEIADMFVSVQSFDDGLEIKAKVDFVQKEENQHENFLLSMLSNALANKYITLGFRIDDNSINKISKARK